MRNLSHTKYIQFINGYLLKYVLVTFSLIEEEFESYSKDEKLLLMQFIGKMIEWIEWTRKEREKHDRT